MVRYLAKIMAEYIAQDDETADVEVLTYGYYLVFQEWLLNIALMLVALPFGLFFHILAAVLVIRMMRFRAGGVHARYSIVCWMTTFAYAYIPTGLAVGFSLSLSPTAFLILYVVGFAILLKYAPAETDIKKVNDSKERRRLKIGSIVHYSILFLVAAIVQVWWPQVAFVIVVSAAITCFFVLPVAYWLYGFDPVTKEERCKAI